MAIHFQKKRSHHQYHLMPVVLLSFLCCDFSWAQEPPTENTKQVEPTKEEDKVKRLEVMRKRSQEKNADVKKTENEPAVQQVNVSAGRQSDDDVRRNSIAGKIVVGREELDRDGDSNVGEILKRLPGVTMGGRPGRGGGVRMRGMGGGYTQILLNGERPPRGFSMEAISPDQIERIEIMRGPVAEFSTQAIAGTINIVLREEFHPKDIDLKLSVGFEEDRVAPNLSINYPGQIGNVNYTLSGSIFKNRQHDESGSEKLEQSIANQVLLTQFQTTETDRSTTGINFTPRISYRFENGDNLNVQPFVMTSHSQSRNESTLKQVPITNDWYATAKYSNDADSTLFRNNMTYQHRFDDASRLNLRVGGGFGKSDNNINRTQFDAQGKLINTIVDLNDTKDVNFSTSGKYTTALDDKRNLSFGWELEAGNREQVRVSLNNGLPQFLESGDNLEANTKRYATFIQTDFEINSQWSSYAGVRWEGIQTYSKKSAYVVNNTSSVISPIVHGVYRIPGWGRDQIRMSLTSSYRAPNMNDIIAVPTISPLNGATRPDRTGNPNLKPELSRGIDIAFEHYLKSAGIMSANFFVRKIDNLIRRRTLLVNNGKQDRWVNSPINIGSAIGRGFELEAKFQTKDFFPEGPQFDIRSNYSFFWSSVDGIQGPNNRLDQQPSRTANFGIDYRPTAIPLTVGGNYNWTPSYINQTSDNQTSISGIKRQIDVYALWKFSPTLKLRLSANNIQANDYYSGSTLIINGVNNIQTNRAKTYNTMTLRLEMKL
jgi:outer membrane receptor for ferrienterochelin and colicins